MADRETVITHLQLIHTWAASARECDLQFFTAKLLEDIAQWTDDAIALLKEQEPKTILDIADSIEGIEVGKCPRCKRTIVNKQNDPTRFCKYCGQAVEWNA